jgi:hypothetical protein
MLWTGSCLTALAGMGFNADKNMVRKPRVINILKHQLSDELRLAPSVPLAMAPDNTDGRLAD